MIDLIPFLNEIEQLKSVVRSGWTAAGRQESTAEHSWRLAIFAGLAAEEYPELDSGRLMMLALVHDLGELYGGDKPAPTCPDPQEKYAEELAAIKKLSALLPEQQGRELMDRWQEYEAGETAVAKLVKALDKAETLLQHNRGKMPPDFDFDFNLDYGAAWFRGDPKLEALREKLDQDTRSHL